MILPSAEVLLIAVAVGLYLYDSLVLVYCNEGLLIPQGRNGWALCFASAHFRVLGKEVFLPNPLLPQRPCFRLAWRFEGGGAGGDRQWTAQRDALRPLVPYVWGIAGGLFLALPLGLFTRLGDRALVVALVLVYGGIAAALVWLWRHRAGFAMTRRRFAALAFECLACPPFAINLVRRISRETPIGEDLVSAARRLLTPADWQVARAELVARVDQEIVFADDDAERMALLDARRRQLMEN